MDDDLQHPPEEIAKLLNTLTDDFDVVYGTPLELQHGLFRNAASRFTKLTLKRVMKADTALEVGAFRLFRTQLRNSFSDFNNPIVNIDVLLTWSTDRFASVAVDHHTRQSGQSGYSVRKLIAHAMSMITGFSNLPLRIASVIGLLFSLLGALLFAFVLTHYMVFGGQVPGFAFLASIIIIFSGVQLFSLGIIGEYIAHIHARMIGKPSYVIRAQTPPSQDTGSNL